MTIAIASLGFDIEREGETISVSMNFYKDSVHQWGKPIWWYWRVDLRARTRLTHIQTVSDPAPAPERLEGLEDALSPWIERLTATDWLHLYSGETARIPVSEAGGRRVMVRIAKQIITRLTTKTVDVHAVNYVDGRGTSQHIQVNP